MPERFSIDDYFAEARSRDEQPLVPTEQVPRILDRPRTQMRRSAAPAPRRHTGWVLLPAAGTLAVLLALWVLWPEAPMQQAGPEITHAEQTEQAPLAFRSIPAPEQTTAGEAQSGAPAATTPHSAKLSAGQQAEAEQAGPERTAAVHQLSTAAPSTTTRTFSQFDNPAPVEQQLIRLTPEQLARLGVTVAGSEAFYTGWTAPRTADIARRFGVSVQDLQRMAASGNIDLRSYLAPVRVTLRTTGVGTETTADNATTQTSAFGIAPRVVSLYSAGTLTTTFWHRSDDALVRALQQRYTLLRDVGTDSTTVRLAPVHFTLENKRDAYFPRVDVVLWFEATPEFIRALPEPYRSALQRESSHGTTNRPGDGYLGMGQATAGAVVHSRLYPNPVTDAAGGTTLQYRLDNERAVTVALHDIFGRELAVLPAVQRTAGEYTATLPLAQRESGVYLVVLTTDRNERVVQRLLVQR